MNGSLDQLLLQRLGRIERQLDILINTPIRARSVRKVRGVYDEEGRFRECGEPSSRAASNVHPRCMGRAARNVCTCEWFYIPKGINELGERA